MILQLTQEEYEYAVAVPAYRKEFASRMPIDELQQWVSRIVYGRPPRGISSDKAMMTKCAFRTHLGKSGLKSQIVLFPQAFTLKQFPCIDDFLGSIVDHEGFHAKEYFTDPFLIIGEPNPAVLELRAVENQIRHASRWNYSEQLLGLLSRQRAYFSQTAKEFNPPPWWQA